MELINESVTIKMGSKVMDFKNLILDNYLDNFARTQLLTDSYTGIGNTLSVLSVALKFDTELDIHEDSEFYGDEFEMFTMSAMDNQINQVISGKQMTIQYKYPLEDQQILVRDTDSFHYDTIASAFNGRKLTAIAFFPTWMCIVAAGGFRIPARAILDVSRYNIYIAENTPLSITRKDIVNSDADFYSPFNSIKGPIHLVPDKNGLNTKISFGNNRQFGILTSIGITDNPRKFENELVIGEDVDVFQEGNQIFFSPIHNAFYGRKIFPNSRLYLGSRFGGKYPLDGESKKYIFLKYKVLEAPSSDGEYVDSGKYYYTLNQVDFIKKDWIDYKIRYDRGD